MTFRMVLERLGAEVNDRTLSVLSYALRRDYFGAEFPDADAGLDAFGPPPSGWGDGNEDDAAWIDECVWYALQRAALPGCGFDAVRLPHAPRIPFFDYS